MAWNTNDIPNLAGKTAVITGANSGLGLESTKALAAKGAHVVAAVRDVAKMERELEAMHRAGRIFYGVHVSDRALTTCMLHEGTTREVHFVDAADGGYAFAAKQLKRQLKEHRAASKGDARA